MNLEKTLDVKVKKIIFQSDTGYTIAKAEIADEFEQQTIKGVMQINPGENYQLTGTFQDDDKYGEFFLVKTYKRPKLAKEDEIIKYLSSGNFEGIGKRTALKIYHQFGNQAIEIIKTEPKRLEEINISDKMREELITKLQTIDLLGDLYLLLTPFGYNDYLVKEIYSFFKQRDINNEINYLKYQPYKLMENIIGFNFDRADELFLAFNNSKDDKERIFYAIKTVIEEYCYQSGDTKISFDELKKSVQKRLNHEIINYHQVLENAVINKKLIAIKEDITTKQFYQAEQAIAKNINLRNQAIINKMNQLQITSEITKLETVDQINYSEQQLKAITNALMNNFSIITGGPGTGKTTILKAIVNIYSDLKYQNQNVDLATKVVLCAPTGRAAQRLKQATNFQAKTIHSLLGWDPYTQKFERAVDNPLSYDLIIVDEFSMVDIFLASALLKAIPPEALIIIVGDQYQLESVNPGNVLGDLIASQKISTVALKQVFRQGEGSTIAKLAKEINLNHEHLTLINTSDMSIINKKYSLIEHVKRVQQKSIDAGYQMMDIQVLYPRYKGKNGIDKLNQQLKPKINNPKQVFIYNEQVYQVGDKVMQLKNNYDKEIYNGDIGKITKIFNVNAKKKELALEVNFRGINVEMSFNNLEDLIHAYAISVHKSQGSEFKVVILPVDENVQMMLTKKLLYTAITRSKDKLIIIGEIDCFINGIKKLDYVRKTNLEALINLEKFHPNPLDFL